MKTLKATNLKQATEALNEIDKELIKKINSDVKVGDRKHYHVILVKIKERAGQVKNDVSVIVQKYTPRSFAKVKKQVAFLGFAQAIVLHDPTQLKEDEVVNLTSHETSQTAAEVKKQLEAKHKAEIDALTKELNAEKVKSKNTPIVENDGTGEGTGTGDGGTADPPAPAIIEVKGDVDFDIEKATVEQLKDFATANEIELNGAKVKDDLKAVIEKWLEEIRNNK